MCTLPADHAGYDVAGCDTTSNAIDAASCNLGSDCAGGYNGAPTKACVTNGDVFDLSGCEA